MKNLLLTITALFIFTINSAKAGSTDVGHVTFVSFTAKVSNGVVSVTWSTSSEVNNDRFEVERSTDGKNWERVGEVLGNGNTNSKIDYSFDDHNAELSKTVYYRLEQFDFSGRGHLTDIREVSKQASKHNVVKHINTMFENQITLNMISISKLNLKLVALDGQTIYTEQNVSVKDDQTLTIENLGHLPAGMYILYIDTNDGNTSSYKLLKNNL